MRRITLGLALVGGILILGSCGGEETAKAVECQYSYNAEASTVEWTAFKFTNKTGVKGTFNDITINAISNATSHADLIGSLGFSINTASVETNDDSRNAKIAQYFFETNNTKTLTGNVEHVYEDGRIDVAITMNSIKKVIPMRYTMTGDVFSLTGTINVLDWNGQAGLDALNAECVINHTGPDGVLKLWSEVDLSFTTKFNASCQ